jgi:surfeit locus 1 family protein
VCFCPHANAGLSADSFISLTSLPDYIYRKVILDGTWDNAHSMLIGPRVRDGKTGVHLITPLMRQDGSTVLVDRGFISQEHGQAALAKHVTGPVKVVGMVRTSQSRNAFTPDNHPEQGVWYWVDIDAMVQQAGGDAANVQPVFIEQIFGLFEFHYCMPLSPLTSRTDGHSGQASAMVARAEPVGRAPNVELSNSHLSYAVTWRVVSFAM